MILHKLVRRCSSRGIQQGCVRIFEPGYDPGSDKIGKLTHRQLLWNPFEQVGGDPVTERGPNGIVGGQLRCRFIQDESGKLRSQASELSFVN